MQAHFAIRFIMRSYAKNFMYKKTVNYKQRQERLATEWDVRVDITEDLSADKIVERVRAASDDLLFALVSGVEIPDNVKGGNLAPSNGEQSFRRSPTTSTEHHVHVCIVLLTPLRRRDVLEMVRGPRKLGDEYCAPRNPKFTYAGWVIHHAKPGYKLDGEPTVRYESGTLPMDALTTDNAMKIKGLLAKWGTDGMKNRFKMYTELLERENIKRKIDQLQMQLEDH
nr:Rep [Kummerowia striata CRESS virus]